MRLDRSATVRLLVVFMNLGTALYCEALDIGQVGIVLGEYDGLSGIREVGSISRDSIFNRFILKRF